MALCGVKLSPPGGFPFRAWGRRRVWAVWGVRKGGEASLGAPPWSKHQAGLPLPSSSSSLGAPQPPEPDPWHLHPMGVNSGGSHCPLHFWVLLGHGQGWLPEQDLEGSPCAVLPCPGLGRRPHHLPGTWQGQEAGIRPLRLLGRTANPLLGYKPWKNWGTQWRGALRASPSLLCFCNCPGPAPVVGQWMKPCCW